MAIGRPISLTPNIATKNISSLATADQTEFTVTGGYRINEIAVYRNGVRLAEGRDFTASDGDTVNLVTAASDSDVIEFAVFDSFNVSDAIVSAASSQNLNGDFNVTGIFYAGDFKTDGVTVGVNTVSTTLHVGSALTANAAGDVETIGIVTAGSFSGDGSALTGLANTDYIVSVATTTGDLTVSAAATIGGVVNIDATTDSTSTSTGALIVDGGAAIAKNVYIGAGLSVAGTLTYEDVTSVDSVGLITAKSGVNITGGELTVGSGITMGIAGVATFSGTGDIHLLDNVRLNIGDGSDLNLYHNGTDSYINNNTGNLNIYGDVVQLRSSGDEYYFKGTANAAAEIYYNNSKKFETTNNGTVTTGIGTFTTNVAVDATFGEANTDANDIVIGSSSDTQKGISIVGSTSGGVGNIYFTDGAGYKNQGYIQYRHADDEMRIRAGGTDILRLTSTKVGVGTTNPQQALHVEAASGDSYVQIDTNGNGGILLDVQGTQRSVFANDSAFSGNLINTAIGAKNNLFIRSGSSYTERLQLTDNGGFLFSNGELVERCNITAGKLSDNTNIDLEDGMVHYFTTQESTTCTPNIRVSSSTSLNDVMDAGDIVTVTVITTAAAGGYSANWTIDGNAVTEEWVGGSAPSAGGSNGLDIYVLTIICTHATNTGDSGFKVIANVSNAT